MKRFDTKTLDWLRVQAWVFIQYGGYAQAILLLKLVLSHKPNCKQAKKMLILALIESGSAQKAERLIQNLLKEKNTALELAGLWFSLSRAQWKNGEEKKARNAYEQYVRLKQNILPKKRLKLNHYEDKFDTK